MARRRHRTGRSHRWGRHPLWKPDREALEGYNFCPRCGVYRARTRNGHRATAHVYWFPGCPAPILQRRVPPCRKPEKPPTPKRRTTP